MKLNQLSLEKLKKGAQNAKLEEISKHIDFDLSERLEKEYKKEIKETKKMNKSGIKFTFNKGITNVEPEILRFIHEDDNIKNVFNKILIPKKCALNKYLEEANTVL